ncbi:MAG: Ger(x)C family spore germination protein [Defluviitaleaceae bacterium]|nr:Ger(x)C family spore germination protein [Defluviitaleaceae bacterium]
MLSINEKISLRQLQNLIIISAIGTGVIILPRRVAEYAGSDGWIIAVLLTILAMGIGALVSTAARLRPGDTFIQSTGHFLTRPVACFLGAVLWLKLVFAAGLELRAFMLVVQEVLLQYTPIFMTGIVMLLVASYAAIKGIETRARVAEVLLALMVLPFIFLIVLAVMDINWSNLQPVFTAPPRNLLQGTLRLGFMFTGLECVLLVSPYIHPKKKMGRAVVAAIGFAGLIITVITVLTLTKFGQGVVDLPWPVLSMMDMLNLPGAFIERQDALMFSFWIITVFAFINTLVFFGGVLIKDCLRKEKEPPPGRPHGPSRGNKLWQIGVLITSAAVFGVCLIPWDETEIYQRLDFMYLTVGLFFLVLLPLILIIASKLKGTKTAVLLVLGIISLSTLSGCWDRVEIENRAFVVAIAIDKATDEEARYAVTLSLPAANDSAEDEEDDDPPYIKKASAKTVTEAIKEINAETDTQLYFGQTKMLVLGNALLEDPDLVNGALDYFNRHHEIDRAMYVLVANGEGADVLAATPPGDKLPGKYVAAIYKDKHKIGGTSFIINLDNLVTQMKYMGTVMVPALNVEDKAISFLGAALINNGAKAGQLDEEELRGYLWGVDNGGLGAIVTTTALGSPIPFKVEKHTANVRFVEHDNKLQAHMQVEISGSIEECPDGNDLLNRESYSLHMAQLLEETIKKEILHTATKMQDELELDGYHWLEIMRKKQHDLYQRYAPRWREVFTGVEVIPDVKVTVKA